MNITTYTIKVNNANTTVAQHAVTSGAGSKGVATLIKLDGPASLDIIDRTTGLGPQHIVAKRSGKKLLLALEGGDIGAPDIIVDNFYNESGSSLLGQAESGQYFEYIPTSGEAAAYVPSLAENVSAVQALGGGSHGSAWLLSSTATTAGAAGGIDASTILAGVVGAGLLAAAAGGSGGSSSSAAPAPAPAPDTTPPATPATPSTYKDNVGSVTGAAQTAPVTDDTTPGINVGPGLTDTPSLYVDGVKVPATYDPVTGTLTPNTPLGIGLHQITMTLTDAAGNESPQSTAMPLTVDTMPPAVTSVQFVGATKNGAGGFDKAIDEGDVMTFSVTMSEDVTVTGNPTLSVNIGGVQRLATFDSVSGNVMTFKYTVVNADFDHNGVQIDADKLALAGGTIKDLDGNAATLTHAAVGADTNYRVDTIDLGGTNGLLIRGAQADGNWYFFWDKNGDGGGSYADVGTYSTMSALNGQTINGVSMTLPEAGLAPLSGGNMPGTAVTGGGVNPTYDGLLAIWDAYNGSGTETDVAGVPTGWRAGAYWSATPSPYGHATVYLNSALVNDFSGSGPINAAYQVL